MSAFEVTEKLLEKLSENKADVIILNFANCDMVGHTGIIEAAVKAVETVDTCVGKVAEKVLSMGGAMLITADHGNADQMIDEEIGGAFTAHTTFPVPFAVLGCGDVKLREGGVLADIAPTMLEILDLPKPQEMTGTSIIK